MQNFWTFETGALILDLFRTSKYRETWNTGKVERPNIFGKRMALIVISSLSKSKMNQNQTKNLKVRGSKIIIMEDLSQMEGQIHCKNKIILIGVFCMVLQEAKRYLLNNSFCFRVGKQVKLLTYSLSIYTFFLMIQWLYSYK